MNILLHEEECGMQYTQRCIRILLLLSWVLKERFLHVAWLNDRQASQNNFWYGKDTYPGSATHRLQRNATALESVVSPIYFDMRYALFEWRDHGIRSKGAGARAPRTPPSARAWGYVKNTIKTVYISLFLATIGYWNIFEIFFFDGYVWAIQIIVQMSLNSYQ